MKVVVSLVLGVIASFIIAQLFTALIFTWVSAYFIVVYKISNSTIHKFCQIQKPAPFFPIQEKYIRALKLKPLSYLTKLIILPLVVYILLFIFPLLIIAADSIIHFELLEFSFWGLLIGIQIRELYLVLKHSKWKLLEIEGYKPRI